MSTELDQRWLELVAAGRAEWSPGMLLRNADGPVRIDAVDGSCPGVLRRCRYTNEVYVADVRCGPRLHWDDPATLGALLGQVRTRRNDPAAHLVPDGDWHVRGDLPWAQYGTGDTEAAALLDALEVAP